MAQRSTPTFGIKTTPADVSYEEIRRVWLEADATPEIGHAWLYDHLLPRVGDPSAPVYEGWTLLAALAAQTQRLRLGLLVTNNRIRLPAVLAKIAATLDVISDGRLDFGIGIGGSGTATLRIVAEHGDIWNVIGPPRSTVEQLSERSRVLDEQCAAIGRDPAEITRSVQLPVAYDESESARGDLRRLVDSGFTHVVLNPPSPYPSDVVRWVTDELIRPTLEHT